MTNDELLAKLLDGELSDTERSELDKRMENSPDLAESVRELTALEGVLVGQLHSDESAMPFLCSVENRVARKISDSGTGKWRWSIIGLLLFSLGLWFFILKPSQQSETPLASEVHEKVAETPRSAPNEKPKESPEKPNSMSDKTTLKQEKQTIASAEKPSETTEKAAESVAEKPQEVSGTYEPPKTQNKSAQALIAEIER